MAEGGEIAPVCQIDETLENIPATRSESESKMDAFDALLERTRSERQNELQRIQNENRPVTGQASRDNIGQFLRKNVELRENVNATGKENVPLNTANVEEHRPEAVVIEIQGLSQQHRVSNVLQTNAFRRHLENIIRGSMRTVSQNHSPASSHQPSVSPASTPARASPISTRAQTPVPDTTNNVVTERRGSLSSSSSSSVSERSVDYNTRVQDPRGLLGAVMNNSLPPLAPATMPAHLAPPTLPSHVAPPTLPLLHDRPTEEHWNMIEELHQESLVQEVSELVHRRLVTSTLEGSFRNVLELHVQNRVQATGTDGNRVQEYIRSIPQSQPHFVNDFSNIGIPPPAENWDNISVTSISATHVPFTQTNLYLSREIGSLKAQLQEMKNMMKVSFDLQMDIQRAIRQEVAAGITAATGGTVASQTAIPKSSPVSDTHCLICLDNHSDSVLYQCGHMCVCYPCGRHLMDRNSKCPVCRAPIKDIIRAYKSNKE